MVHNSDHKFSIGFFSDMICTEVQNSCLIDNKLLTTAQEF